MAWFGYTDGDEFMLHSKSRLLNIDNEHSCRVIGMVEIICGMTKPSFLWLGLSVIQLLPISCLSGRRTLLGVWFVDDVIELE